MKTIRQKTTFFLWLGSLASCRQQRDLILSKVAKKKTIPTNRHDEIETEEIDDSVEAGDSQSSAESEDNLSIADEEGEQEATFDSIGVNAISCEKKSSPTSKPSVHTNNSMPINPIAHTNHPMPIASIVHTIDQTNLDKNRLIDVPSSRCDEDSILVRLPSDQIYNSVRARMSCFSF